jgi:hypothetical protein
MLVTGPHRVPRRGAWRVDGCYAGTAWEPGAHSRPRALAALDDAELAAAIQRGDAELAMRLMRLDAKAIVQEAMQLSFDASRLRGEVFITDEVCDASLVTPCPRPWPLPRRALADPPHPSLR